MNRRNGLLAFLCTVVSMTAAVLQVPVVSGIEDIGRLVTGARPDSQPSLAIALTPPTASQIPAGPGGTQPLTLFALQREKRIDDELKALSAKHAIPFTVLKAHLAQSCKGVLGDEGHYWAWLAEGEDRIEDDGKTRTDAAAALLGRYRKETGSLAGALMAWEAGTLRASRVSQSSDLSLDEGMTALRKRMIAPYRDDARRWLCTVWGLATALQARWPVQDRDIRQVEGAGVRLAAGPGEPVVAAMPGKVGFAGRDGTRGLCVEVVHACELRTEVCDLKTIRVGTGRRVEAGSVLGTVGRMRPRFNLWLGVQALDVTQLLPPQREERP